MRLSCYIFGYESFEVDTLEEIYDSFGNELPVEILGRTWQYTWYDRYSMGHSKTQYYYFIPDSLSKVTITKQSTIPTAAFNGCSNLTEIVYTSKFKTQINIGEAAFQNCSNLRFSGDNFGKVEITDYVCSIGKYAFAGCENITEVIVSPTVRNIDYAAFMNCKNIESMELPFVGKSEDASRHEAVLGYIFGYESFEIDTSEEIYDSFGNELPVEILGRTWQYTWYDRYSMGHSKTQYYYFIPESLSEVTITKQKNIPLAAFNGCKNLKTITILADSTIGEYAFQDCNAKIIEK